MLTRNWKSDDPRKCDVAKYSPVNAITGFYRADCHNTTNLIMTSLRKIDLNQK